MKKIGTKYHTVKDKPLKDIAKLIKQDLKKFDDCVFSVTAQKGVIGSITIQLIAVENPSNRLKLFNGTPVTGLWFNKSFEKEIREIVDAYNYDNSDLLSDYSDKNFFTSIFPSRILRNIAKENQ